MMFQTLLSALTLLPLVASSLNRPGPVPLTRRQDVDPEELYTAYNLSGVPIDHFHNDSMYEPHSNGTFNLRYYFDSTYYKPGGPVILLQGGETSVTGRLPYLQEGIVYQLAKATGGMGVILEHRYYGTSFPVSNLTTENLRFLTTAQAMADQAYFQQNIVFPGFEDHNLTAPATPYIIYGGSYAGGFVAFMRKLYPDITWGAVSSSGVTEALWDFWKYYEAIFIYGPPACIANQQKLMNVIDNIIANNDTETINNFKSAFAMSDLSNVLDVANVVSYGIQGWQGRNWDPAVNDPSFYEYCGNITSNETQWQDTDGLMSNASALISAGGWGNESDSLTIPMLNLMGYTNFTQVSGCESTQNECFGWSNASTTMFTDKSIGNYGNLSWAYQYCTQWGYIQSGHSLDGQLPIIPLALTTEYLSLICPNAFNLTSPADVEAINQYGSVNISYPRLALIGGQEDPWRYVTPLAPDVPDRLNESSTVSQPIIVIEGAVHHWDENGIFPNETTAELPPPPVANAQAEIAQFVQAWFAEWQQHCINSPGEC